MHRRLLGLVGAVVVLALGLSFSTMLANADSGAEGAARAKLELAKVEGQITAIDVSAGTVTITPEHGAPITLTLNDSTKIEVAEDVKGALSDLRVGERVEVKFNDATNVASKIEVSDENEDEREDVHHDDRELERHDDQQGDRQEDRRDDRHDDRQMDKHDDHAQVQQVEKHDDHSQKQQVEKKGDHKNDDHGKQDDHGKNDDHGKKDDKKGK